MSKKPPTPATDHDRWRVEIHDAAYANVVLTDKIDCGDRQVITFAVGKTDHGHAVHFDLGDSTRGRASSWRVVGTIGECVEHVLAEADEFFRYGPSASPATRRRLGKAQKAIAKYRAAIESVRKGVIAATVRRRLIDELRAAQPV